jgi:transcriptional regulator with XRE-family HTH domain
VQALYDPVVYDPVVLGLSGEQLGSYLHTDKTKISKWERGEDPIGPAADRLVRLLATALDGELRPGISAVAEHLPQISDKPGEFWELHVDVVTLQTTFLAIPKAA